METEAGDGYVLCEASDPMRTHVCYENDGVWLAAERFGFFGYGDGVQKRGVVWKKRKEHDGN